MNRICRLIAIVVIGLGLHPAYADFDSSWFTIAAGGGTSSDGVPGGLGQVAVVGQHAAGTSMSGGGFVMVGGFLAIPAPTCACPGDVNGDDEKNGRDIHHFVQCALGAGIDCSCANVDGVPGVSTNDVTVFVADLLTGGACP